MIIFRCFNTLFSITDRLSSQKIIRDKKELKNTIKQSFATDIIKTLITTAQPFFSLVHVENFKDTDIFWIIKQK